MTDNTLQTGTSLIATDEVTYSGDSTANVQLMRLVQVAGAEGSKTVVGDALPALATTVPDNTEQGLPARLIGQDITTCSYANVSASGSLSDEVVDLVKAASVGVSQSSGNLVITTGTTANAEYLSRSVKAWRGSWLARMKFIASQRIANQNFMFLLADRIADAATYTINSATSVTVAVTGHPYTAANVGQGIFIGGITGAAGVPMRGVIASVVAGVSITFTVAGWPASGTGTCYLFGHSHIKLLFNGTTATAAAFDAQRRGWASGDTAISTGNTGTGIMAQIHSAGREVFIADALVASSLTPNVIQRASRVENIPDDNLDLYFYIWSYNGTTAPASTTTFTIGFWDVEKFANLPVYIAGQRAQGGANAAQVSIQGTVTLAGGTSVALSAGTNLASDVGQQYRASATGAAGGTHVVSAATTNATVIKASAGRVIGWNLANTSASWKYVKLHNQTASPTAGAGVVRTIAIPPNNVSHLVLEGGIAFATGIGMTIVNGSADSDATAVAVGDVVGDIFFA